MTMDGITVRVARPSETVALHELWLVAPDKIEWAPAEGPHAPLLAELDVLVADKRVWAAFDESGAPVGFSAAGEVDSKLFLTALGVADVARGKSVGRALLAPILKFGRAGQYPAVVAVARRHGISEAFLRQNGFIEMPVERLTAGLRAVLSAPPAGLRRAALARLL